MKRNRLWLLGLLILTALVIALWGRHIWIVTPVQASLASGAIATTVSEESQNLPAVRIPGTPPANPNAASSASNLAELQKINQTTASIPLDGHFVDTQDNYQIGILEGYGVTSIGNSPLIEAPDGHLAYTVVTVPQVQNSFDRPLSDAALAQVAQGIFSRGEGFQATPYRSVPGGVQISWTGQLTLGGVAQPVGGELLALQTEKGITVLLVAATAVSAEEVPAAFSTLTNSLQFL